MRLRGILHSSWFGKDGEVSALDSTEKVFTRDLKVARRPYLPLALNTNSFPIQEASGAGHQQQMRVLGQERQRAWRASGITKPLDRANACVEERHRRI